jgi:5-deoxy-D-glucuronate isomerase
MEQAAELISTLAERKIKTLESRIADLERERDARQGDDNSTTEHQESENTMWVVELLRSDGVWSLMPNHLHATKQRALEDYRLMVRDGYDACDLRVRKWNRMAVAMEADR